MDERMTSPTTTEQESKLSVAKRLARSFCGPMVALIVMGIGIVWHPRTLRGRNVQFADPGLIESVVGTPGILNLLRVVVVMGIAYLTGWFAHLLMNKHWPTEISKGSVKFGDPEVLSDIDRLTQDNSELRQVVEELEVLISGLLATKEGQ